MSSMYKVSNKLYINLKYVSTLYRSERNNGWRLVMVGASDADEYPLTEEEAKMLLKVLDIYNTKTMIIS